MNVLFHGFIKTKSTPMDIRGSFKIFSDFNNTLNCHFIKTSVDQFFSNMTVEDSSPLVYLRVT